MKKIIFRLKGEESFLTFESEQAAKMALMEAGFDHYAYDDTWNKAIEGRNLYHYVEAEIVDVDVVHNAIAELVAKVVAKE